MGFALVKGMRISDTSFLDPATAGDAPRKNRFSVNRMAGTVPTWKRKVEAANFAPSQIVSAEIAPGHKPGFRDLVDIINPLQHIPLVGHLYRKATGDEISPVAQFIGSTLYGGPLGAVASITDIAAREQTGKGSLDTMMGFFGRGTGPAADEPDFSITLGKRKPQAPRMAGTIPVWGQNTQLAAKPSPNLSPQTNFALLLNDLTDKTHNIS